jgi:Arc/MetJ-type ribon-helix-helix transcriptional regulator
MIGLTKKKTSVTLDSDLLLWIEKKVKEKKFASVSHAVAYALEELKKRDP